VRFLRHALLIAAVLPGACTSPPPATQPPLPDTAQPAGDWTAPFDGRTKIEPTAWLDQFDDARLRAVVQEAVANNPDLHAASARMRQARIRATRDRAALLPEMTAGARAAQSGERAGRWDFDNDYALALSAAWEPDVWGRIRDSTSASQAAAQAAEADYAAARLSLAANAARAYCNLIEAEQQVALGRRTVESYDSQMGIVDKGFDRGLLGAADVRLIRSDVASARSNLEARLRARDAARRSLEALLGRYPSGSIGSPNQLPGLRRAVPAGLPGTLLLRRPDILAAERRVAAALRNEDAARKALLPSFRLTAAADSGGFRLSDLLDERKLTAALLESLTQPLYRGGALRADIRLSEAQRQELVSEYAATAIEAFREVETALAAESFLRQQISAQQSFVSESVASRDMRLARFERGIAEGGAVAVLTVLETRRRVFDSESGLLRLQNQLLQARIDLCLALGGGF
jgi:multidrug efflux system outer membrane protein